MQISSNALQAQFMYINYTTVWFIPQRQPLSTNHWLYPTLETHWYWMANTVSNVCTNSSYECSSRSVGVTATYYSDLCNKINKCLCITHVSPHVINYQHVSNTFAFIIGVDLQEYAEYNNMPHWISGTTQCYIKFLKHSVFPITHFYSLLYSLYSCNATLMVDHKSDWYMLVNTNIS